MVAEPIPTLLDSRDVLTTAMLQCRMIHHAAWDTMPWGAPSRTDSHRRGLPHSLGARGGLPHSLGAVLHCIPPQALLGVVSPLHAEAPSDAEAYMEQQTSCLLTAMGLDHLLQTDVTSRARKRPPTSPPSAAGGPTSDWDALHEWRERQARPSAQPDRRSRPRFDDT